MLTCWLPTYESGLDVGYNILLTALLAMWLLDMCGSFVLLRTSRISSLFSPPHMRPVPGKEREGKGGLSVHMRLTGRPRGRRNPPAAL
ncbi:hypothetical protein GGR56DRAFT_265110 [Xylariaceae sp. FL0804]|nr:hypothetical protein GGR56DRAFT_265110 [Xylariaceae sp. FL0804]